MNLKDLKLQADEYSKKKDWDKVIEVCNEIINQKSDDKDAYRTYYVRGLAYGHKEEYDLAIEDYTQAIEFKRNFAEAYNGRGNVYNEKNEYDLAIEDYDEALKFKPDFKEAIHNRAIALAMKDSEKEKKEFKKELEDKVTNQQKKEFKGFRKLLVDTKIDSEKKIEEFKKKLEKEVTNQQKEYFKKSSELLVSTKIDEERKEEYQKKLGDTEKEINSLLKRIKYFGVLLYGLIFVMFFLSMPLWSAFFGFPKFDFEPWSFIPLTFIAGLCLSPLLLSLRIKSRQMNYWLALLEDAYSKMKLATLINTTEFGSVDRQELMLKFFEHFEKHNTSDLIAGWGKNNKSNPTNNVNGFVDGVRKGGQDGGG